MSRYGRTEGGWRRGGPHPGPYFDKMTLTGGVHAKLTRNQESGVWLGACHLR